MKASNCGDIAREKVNLETSKIAWKELQRFFASGTAVFVASRWIWSMLPTSFLSTIKIWLHNGCKTTRSPSYPINKQLSGWNQILKFGRLSLNRGYWFRNGSQGTLPFTFSPFTFLISFALRWFSATRCRFFSMPVIFFTRVFIGCVLFRRIDYF